MSVTTNIGTRNFKNYIINGGLDYWQRNNNLSIVSDLIGYQSVDRFYLETGGTAAGNRQSAAQSGDRPNELTRQSAFIGFNPASGNYVGITQRIESIIARDLAGQICSFGFWYKTDQFQALRIRVFIPTTTDNYSSATTIYDQTFTITPDQTWRQFKLQGALNISSTAYLGCQIAITAQNPLYTSGGARYFRYSQIQLNIGSVLPPFSYFAEDLASELAVCQRYYEKSYDLETTPGTATFNGCVNVRVPGNVESSIGGTYHQNRVSYKVQKRNNGSAVSLYSRASGTINNVTDATDGTNIAANPGSGGETGFDAACSARSLYTATVISFHWVASCEI